MAAVPHFFRFAGDSHAGRVEQAVLRTDGMQLVPLAEEHLEHEVALDSDPEVMRYLAGRARTRGEVERLHRQRLDTAQRVPGLGFWVGFAQGVFVGWWFVQPRERPYQGPVQGQAELGYRLLHRYWRQGLGSEGARELLRHGFQDLSLSRIFAETMTVNTASRAIMEAVGLQYVRTFHSEEDQHLPNADQGGVEYAITHQQWRAHVIVR